MSWSYQPLPTPRRFHGDIRTRFKGFSGPIGSGKSYALVYESLFLSNYNAGLMGLVGAPSYPMLRDVTLRAFFEILDRERIGYTFTKSEMSMVLAESGSTILFRSVDDFEKLRGTNLAWFGVDELTYTKPDVWLRLEGRLREPRALRPCGFGVWTPKGFDWVYERFIDPGNRDKFKAYRAYLGSPRENPHSLEMYDSLAASYDPRFYQQEVEGSYLNVQSGSVYFGFNRASSVMPLAFERQGAGLAWSLDFNVDPMCSVIAQIDDRSTWQNRDVRINVLDEIYLQGGCSTEQATREFVERARGIAAMSMINVTVYGDSAGNQRQTGSGGGTTTDWKMVKEILSRESWMNVTYKIRTSHNLVRDRVNTVNAALCNSQGLRRLHVDPKCSKLIRDLEQVVWMQGSQGFQIDKSNHALTHISDALGYMVEIEMPLKGTAGFQGGTLI